MGVLVGIRPSIIASARLDAATNALGTLNELYVIAAAVIGGTSLAGGVGTIYGAMLGRAADAVAAVGHGAAECRFRLYQTSWSASCWCSPCSSTRSIAAA